MKVSSLTANAIESALFSLPPANPLLHYIKNKFASLSKVISQIGTAIELGEKGDLDAAHQFRIKNLKVKK